MVIVRCKKWVGMSIVSEFRPNWVQPWLASICGRLADDVAVGSLDCAGVCVATKVTAVRDRCIRRLMSVRLYSLVAPSASTAMWRWLSLPQGAQLLL